jgi:hypothetical protein
MESGMGVTADSKLIITDWNPELSWFKPVNYLK